ncbi:MAG: tetratricopeptide repeat protein [Planctomycetota bacterium]
MSRIASMACCGLLSFVAAAAIAAQQPAPTVTPAAAQSGLRERAQAALARDPRSLAFAPEGRWSKWSPKEVIPAELSSDLVAGRRAYTAGDYAASLAYLYALLDRESEFPPALYQAGICYFRLRRYGDAAVLLERFAHVAPQEIGATQALGHCYYSLGDYERARDHYGKVLAASPSSPEAVRGLALSEMRLGNSKRATELLNKVLELRPDHADAHAWLAQILYDDGETSAALVHAERARDLEPWEPRPWFLLSHLYAESDRQADADQAQERFESTSRLAQQILQQQGLLLHDPAKVDVWRELIALQRSVGNREEVRDALPHLIALGTSEPRTAVMIVDMFEWLGDKQRAKLAARTAEVLAGADKQSWLWLADFYRRIGDAESAKRAQAAADAAR